MADSTTSTSSVEVDAPPEVVWRWLTDPGRLSRMSAAMGMPIEESALPAEADLHPGFRASISVTPEAPAVTMHLIEFDPPHRYVSESHHPHVETRDEHILATSGTRTQITTTRQTTYLGVAATTMQMPGVVEQMALANEQTLRQWHATLKSMVEAEA